MFSVFNKSSSQDLGCLKFSKNSILKIYYNSDQITCLPWPYFTGRTEMFGVYVALGDVEMLNYVLKSVLRGEKKHFMQVWSILLRSVLASPQAVRLSLIICFLTDCYQNNVRKESPFHFQQVIILALVLCCTRSVFCPCSLRVQRARPFSCHAFCFQALGKRAFLISKHICRIK